VLEQLKAARFKINLTGEGHLIKGNTHGKNRVERFKETVGGGGKK